MSCREKSRLCIERISILVIGFIPLPEMVVAGHSGVTTLEACRAEKERHSPSDWPVAVSELPRMAAMLSYCPKLNSLIWMVKAAPARFSTYTRLSVCGLTVRKPSAPVVPLNTPALVAKFAPA